MAYDVDKIRFYSDLVKYISSKDYYKNARILIAPVGTGEESLYLMNIYKSIYGIDISNTALLCCPGHIKTIEGDILESGFENEYFDIIICPLFLHHVHKIGFLPFLQEFHRILKRGGVLAIQEPNILYPLFWVTSFLRKLLGNVTRLVPDEKPIYPNRLTKDLNNVGFSNISIKGLSLSHQRIPIFIQAIFLLFDFLFRNIWPLKLLYSHIAWYCEKPE